jgi:hypothetical protein
VPGKGKGGGCKGYLLSLVTAASDLICMTCKSQVMAVSAHAMRYALKAFEHVINAFSKANKLTHLCIIACSKFFFDSILWFHWLERKELVVGRRQRQCPHNKRSKLSLTSVPP